MCGVTPRKTANCIRSAHRMCRRWQMALHNAVFAHTHSNRFQALEINCNSTNELLKIRTNHGTFCSLSISPSLHLRLCLCHRHLLTSAKFDLIQYANTLLFTDCARRQIDNNVNGTNKTQTAHDSTPTERLATWKKKNWSGYVGCGCVCCSVLWRKIS